MEKNFSQGKVMENENLEIMATLVNICITFSSIQIMNGYECDSTCFHEVKYMKFSF